MTASGQEQLTPPVFREAVKAPVVTYVTEEVWRHGHDVEKLDGISRVGWMLNAWAYALGKVSVSRMVMPCVKDAVRIGKMIEPAKNRFGIRTTGVRVGGRICPPAEVVPDLLNVLFERVREMEPLEFYKEFEEVHPFIDGNGRTGKVLLNWLNGTLLVPIFPPKDLWGYPIQNP